MAKSSRVPRDTAELLHALDQHQYLLRDHLHGLRQDSAHLRGLATELRTLVCLSTGTEGLLWRLADELRVSDEIPLECGGSVDRDHPLARGLSIATIPIWRPGQGPAGLTTEHYSLRDVIKNHEAIFVSAVQDVVYTHELLIGAIAGQMGAHEAEGLDYKLVRLNQFLLNQQQTYVRALAFDAELTLQVGERVLDQGQQLGIHQRVPRGGDEGNVTLVVRFSLKNPLGGQAPVVTFHFPVSETQITLVAGPASAFFALIKRGKRVAELTVPYPVDWGVNSDAVFALSYSSNHRQARTILNDKESGPPVDCDLGWLDAREVGQLQRHDTSRDFVAVTFGLSYTRLLRPSGCGEILQLSPDMRELMLQEPAAGPFPR